MGDLAYRTAASYGVRREGRVRPEMASARMWYVRVAQKSRRQEVSRRTLEGNKYKGVDVLAPTDPCAYNAIGK